MPAPVTDASAADMEDNAVRHANLRFLAIALALMASLPAHPARSETVIVSNEKDNTLSVIDGATLTVTKTVPVGQRPRGITLNGDGSRLYVCASDDDRIEVFDTATMTKVEEIPSGVDPEQFALHPDDRQLYIANENDDVVTVVDTGTRHVIGQIDVGVEPEGMAVSPNGRIAINTSETTNMVHWIDTASLALIDNTLVDQRPRYGEFSRDGARLWVSSEIGGSVAVIDVDRREVIKTIRFRIGGVAADRIQPVGMELTADGRYAFVALGPANHVAVIDAKSFEVLDYILVGRRVWHLALSPDQKRLYTTNGISGDVTAIDVATRKPIKSIKVGRYPWGVVVKP